MVRLDGVANLPAVLVGAQPAQRSLQPLLAIVAEVGVEPAGELLPADAPPVAAAPELVLEPAEEALAGGVVGRAPLPRERTDDAQLLAQGHPLGRPVAPAAVRVDDRRAVGEGPRALHQHLPDQGLVGAGTDRPGRGPPVVQVDHRRQVDLSGRGEPELGDVGGVDEPGGGRAELVEVPALVEQQQVRDPAMPSSPLHELQGPRRRALRKTGGGPPRA